ncbi:MAG: hypothetical protein LBM78_02380 [Clostridiales bacterium]|jgi:hypothetical protein|nr:hypothetical protein [Clostridiales bacterium]
MKDLRAMTNERRGKPLTAPDEPPATQPTKQNVAELIAKYADKSPEELQAELLTAVASGRAAGTLKDGDLDGFAARAAALLAPAQAERLREMVRGLKNNA